jgi:hypothetical protein
MKKTHTVLFSALFLLVALLAGQSALNAVPLGSETLTVQSFGAKFTNGNNLEIVYVAKTGKLGVVLKNSEGEPVAAHLLQGVKNPNGTFELADAKKYGKADESSLVSINISNFSKDSLAVKVNGESTVYNLKLISQQAFDLAAESGLKCDNYCRPSDPNQFNWWLCFWCCSTASGPCV